MGSGRSFALTTAGILGLLALLDVRPVQRVAPGSVHREHTIQTRAGSPVAPRVTSRDERRPAPPRRAPEAGSKVELVGAATVDTAQSPDHAVVLVGAGDGHAFGYRRADLSTSAVAEGSADAPAPRGAAAPARAAGRAAVWGWRADEVASAGAAPRAGGASAGPSVTRGVLDTDGVEDEAGRSLRITQTFAYVHGATSSASTSAGSVGGFEMPDDPETDVDLGGESDTGTGFDPVRRRHGGGGRHGERPATTSTAPSRADTRGPPP